MSFLCFFVFLMNFVICQNLLTICETSLEIVIRKINTTNNYLQIYVQHFKQLRIKSFIVVAGLWGFEAWHLFSTLATMNANYPHEFKEAP